MVHCATLASQPKSVSDAIGPGGSRLYFAMVSNAFVKFGLDRIKTAGVAFEISPPFGPLKSAQFFDH